MNLLKEMAEFQKKSEEAKRVVLEEFNKLKYDIYEVSDEKIGGIFFYDTDAILQKEKNSNHPIFKIFDINVLENRRKYTCNLNDRIILRGPDNYYFGVSYLSDLDVKKEEIVSCMIKVKDFAIKIKKEISDDMTFTYDNILDLKLILAILDIIRNSVITNLFFCLMKEKQIKDIYIYENGDIYLAKEFYELLNEIEQKFIDIILYQENRLFNNINNIIDKFILLQEKLIKEIDINEEDYKNDLYIRFRKLREADNVIENIITIRKAIENIKKLKIIDNVYVLGINYGGIELAIIANILLKKKNIDTKVGNIMKKFRKVYIEATNNQNEIDNLDIQDNSSYILLDENILTGSTIINIIKYLKLKKLNFLDAIIIQYPTIARAKNIINEIKNEDEYINFIKEIKGMLIPTNYSKLCEYRKDFIFPYMDKLGTFDLRKYEVLKNMYKNGLYNETSAVGRVSNYYKDIFM